LVERNKTLIQNFMLIGALLGAVAGFLVPMNLLQYWKRIAYFPYPVEKIAYINVWGETIWVEADGGELFTLQNPCVERPCWEKALVPPDYSDRSDFGPGYQMEVNETCKFENFTYPLFRKTKMCASTNYPVADMNGSLYLALSADGEIFVWRSGFLSLRSLLCLPPVFAFFGLFAGLVLAGLIIATRKLKALIIKRDPL
jgi:hypothetical protein